jgi:hypothetical protein
MSVDHLDSQLDIGPQPAHYRWEATDQLTPEEEREYSAYLDRLYSTAVDGEVVQGIDPFF